MQSLWILICLSIVREFSSGKEKLYIGTFYGVNVSSIGWSSEGVMPAVQMALDHVNKDQSILPEYTLHEDWRDSKCDSGAAIRAMLDLVSKPPTKIMFTAPGCSLAAEPIAEAASFWKAVQVGFSNSSPLLSDDSRFPLYSRISPSSTLSNAAIVLALKRLNWNRVAILAQQGHIFTKTKEDLISRLSNNGVTIEFTESFAEETNFPIRSTKDKDVRIIVALMYEDKFIKIACQAFKQGIYGRKYVWFVPGWYSERWWANTEDVSCNEHEVKTAAGNYFATRPLRLGISPSPTIAGKTATKLSEELKERIRRDNYPINTFSSFAYDTIWSIALTLHHSSSILNARRKSLVNVTYGDSEAADIFIKLLRNLTFLGMSGTVKFDDHGERETTIEILQRQGDAMIVVGFWNKSSNNIDESLFSWEGKRPRDGMINRKDDYQESYEQTIITLALSVTGMLFSCACLVVNISYRKYRVIKMSSPHFNSVTAIGCLMIYTHELLASFNNSRIYSGDSRSLCLVSASLIVIGFTFIFGGMFAKTWRVYKIFTNRRLKREIGGLTTARLMTKICSILLLDTVVLVSWELVDPLQSEHIEISKEFLSNDEDIQVHIFAHQCDSKHFKTWMLGIIAYKGVLLLFGVFLAWETRNVHYAELNDSKNIGLAVYNILVFSALSITAEFVLNEQAFATKRIFNNLLMYLCTSMVLILVFLPKISRLTRRREVQPIESGDHGLSRQSSLRQRHLNAGESSFVVSESEQMTR